MFSFLDKCLDEVRHCLSNLPRIKSFLDIWKLFFIELKHIFNKLAHARINQEFMGFGILFFFRGFNRLEEERDVALLLHEI